jgi:hypothetical protein
MVNRVLRCRFLSVLGQARNDMGQALNDGTVFFVIARHEAISSGNLKCVFFRLILFIAKD